MLRSLLTSSVLFLLTVIHAQTSRYLGSVEVAGPAALEYGGPYHLDDTTVIYRADGYAAFLLANPEQADATATQLGTTEGFEGPIYGLTQGADGTVFLLTGGGYCDVVSPEWALFAVSLGEDGVWVGKRVGEPFEFFASYTQEPVHFDVAADSTLWLVNGLDVVRWRPGGKPEIGAVDEQFVSLGATDGKLVAVSRDVAFSTNGFYGYRLTRDGDGYRRDGTPMGGLFGRASKATRGGCLLGLQREDLRVQRDRS